MMIKDVFSDPVYIILFAGIGGCLVLIFVLILALIYNFLYGHKTMVDLRKTLVKGIAPEEIKDGETNFRARISICAKKNKDGISYDIQLLPNTTRQV